MSKPRRARKPLPLKRLVPFTTAEEAWFWFVNSERARREGARLTEGLELTARPCEPDDIYRAVMALHVAGRIQARHLKVLAAYGWRGSSPDRRVLEERPDLVLWDDVLDRLTTVLAEKGIVEHDADMGQTG